MTKNELFSALERLRAKIDLRGNYDPDYRAVYWLLTAAISVLLHCNFIQDVRFAYRWTRAGKNA